MLYTDEQLREMVDKRLPPGPGARTKALALLREVRDTYENRRAATSNDLDDANRRIADLTDELRIWRAGCERVQAEQRAGKAAQSNDVHTPA